MRRSARSVKSSSRPLPQRSDDPPSLPTRRPVKRLLVFFLVLGSAIVLIVGVTALLIYNAYSRPRHDSKPLTASVSIAPFVSLTGDNQFPVGLAGAPDGTFYLTLFGTGAI